MKVGMWDACVSTMCVAFGISWSSNALYWAAVWAGSIVLVAVLTPDEDGCVCTFNYRSWAVRRAQGRHLSPCPHNEVTTTPITHTNLGPRLYSFDLKVLKLILLIYLHYLQ